eukprot:363200-Chlamydomonas_euryale.AAC.9
MPNQLQLVDTSLWTPKPMFAAATAQRCACLHYPPAPACNMCTATRVGRPSDRYSCIALIRLSQAPVSHGIVVGRPPRR